MINQPNFCPVCGKVIDDDERFCSSVCQWRFYDEMDEYWEDESANEVIYEEDVINYEK